MDTISEDRFMTDYRPLEVGAEGESMLDTFGDALALATEKGGGINNVWTILESGDDDDNLYASAGNHLVNRLGYLVTEVPWDTGIEDAIWFEDDFEDKDSEE